MLRKVSKWATSAQTCGHSSLCECVRPTDFGEINSREIHIFADASMVGYGGGVSTSLWQWRSHPLFVSDGKACLASIKAVTIPCLELTAATLSVRLGEVLKKELGNIPDTIQYHTDSTTVLRYIANDQKRFQVFVANRVQTIRNFSSPKQSKVRGYQRKPCRWCLSRNWCSNPCWTEPMD